MTEAPAWENRIVGEALVSPAELTANPRNWRTHPANQRDALEAVLDRIGWVQKVVVNQRSGFVVDGHLRVAVALEREEETIPVVYVDLADEEEALILATFDPIGAMASRDESILASLLSDIQTTENETLDALLAKLRDDPLPTPPALGPNLRDRFLVPPFSVLDARQGYWQERKRAWIDIGIRSEIGRGENLLGLTPAEERVMGEGGLKAYQNRLAPGGAPLPAAKLGPNGKTERGDGRGRRLTWVAGGGEASDDTSKKILKGGRKPATTFGGQDSLNDAMVARGADLQASGTSIFDPVLCELAYRWFSPEGGVVLDPFAGGSVRGIVAAMLGRSYHGIDLADGQVTANREQWLDISSRLSPDATAPDWNVGDSRDMDVLLPGVLADLVFTCPPYGDLERYSDDPRDISNMDYPAFLKALRTILRESVTRLRDNRFVVLVVGDFRAPDGNYRGFVKDTIEAAYHCGLELYNDAVLVTAVGSLSIRAGRYFSGSRKLGKSHQNVLVFVKGDARTAHRECGAIDIPEDAELFGHEL